MKSHLNDENDNFYIMATYLYNTGTENVFIYAEHSIYLLHEITVIILVSYISF